MKDFRLYSRLGLLIECLVDKILRSMKGFIEKTSADIKKIEQSVKIRTLTVLVWESVPRSALKGEVH